MAIDDNWWAYGTYAGTECPNCGRERVLRCTDGAGKDHLICEKCEWDLDVGAYFARPELS